jgi:hypothetical protein
MAPVVDSYTFSHRFSDTEAVVGFSSYEDIQYQCQPGPSVHALVRSFLQFALACGWPQSAVLNAFADISEEYADAAQRHCERQSCCAKAEDQ